MFNPGMFFSSLESALAKRQAGGSVCYKLCVSHGRKSMHICMHRMVLVSHWALGIPSWVGCDCLGWLWLDGAYVGPIWPRIGLFWDVGCPVCGPVGCGLCFGGTYVGPIWPQIGVFWHVGCPVCGPVGGGLWLGGAYVGPIWPQIGVFWHVGCPGCGPVCAIFRPHMAVCMLSHILHECKMSIHIYVYI